ncbi:ABC transporter [Ahniella affigens]|uniref:ABC transporter n=1 Tax=Ahniella affigens TaxID=2021234 RepID=A0A2P1PQK7_9GAMM|nr:ABC transporter ATP-binding protein [Ahniella affigens]AVP97125.1 ABC transporter [Ahniella affigens]
MRNALALQQINKTYDHFRLHDIDLSVPEGQIMGLVGVNGAGKTTLMRILMGLIRPDSGNVEVLGLPMPDAQVAAKRDIGFASEDMRLYQSQSLRWHMDFVSSIYPSWDEHYAEELMKRFDLRAEQVLRGFSHGQRVKAMLLLNLARRPKLLLLDEPTTGLDPVARSEVLEALSDVLRDETRTVMFSSHNTHDVEQLSDTITFMHQGRILACKDKESFLDDWRRILCQGTLSEQVKGLPGVAMARQNGSIVEIKVRHYRDDLPEALRKEGLLVQRVEPMNLEDIFVTTVRAGASA